MARVFAQEAMNQCAKQGVYSRYEMILLAAHRARQISRGIKPIVEEQQQRGQSITVNALRDFETGNIDFEELQEDLVKSMQQVKETSIQEDEE